MTAQSVHSKAAVALGKKIVSELKLESSVDTLGRWMVCHIAELIQQAEIAKESERVEKNTQLREAILALWDHRQGLPIGNKPLEDLEPLIRALESFDPSNATPRYYRPRNIPSETEEESEDTQRWIELAKGLDHSCKILMNYILALAAESAVDKSQEWIQLAKEANLDNSFELQFVELFSDECDLLGGSELDQKQEATLKDRFESLKAFISLASAAVEDIEHRLKT